ncbi:hypothetical protein Nepgr_002183 [Nepenthes gracilis]|uniref:TMEM205-like domain-containing protein n=1 Tax=Nepenthes gracilis TaxID=150966 RepID=A0AAD3P5S1_NEPGR|nr:hypothetical protein Nepgr_002183 [Nepenthes gracilis]
MAFGDEKPIVVARSIDNLGSMQNRNANATCRLNKHVAVSQVFRSTRHLLSNESNGSRKINRNQLGGMMICTTKSNSQLIALVKMMNLLTISLLTSLTFAGIFSPTPAAENKNQGEQIIVGGVHRVVLVEYADSTGEGKTKVSISPPSAADAAASAQDKLSSVAASVAGVAEDAKDKLKEEVTTRNGYIPGPRELICDTFGKCKHKIAGAFSRAKEKVVETVHEVEEETKEVLGGAVHKAKEMVCKVEKDGEEIGEKAKDAAEVFMEKYKGKSEDMSAYLESASGKAIKNEETMEDEAKKAKESFVNMVEKVKHESEVFVEKSKRAGEDLSKDFESSLEQAADKAKEAGKMVEDRAKKVKEKGEKGKKKLSDVAWRGKEVFCNVLRYTMSPELAKPLLGVLQLLGFSTAYGVSVWVTFAMSYVLAGVLPRQQFAVVQSKIYPAYFKVMTFGIGMSLLGHLWGKRSEGFFHKTEMLQGYNLLACLLFVLANQLSLEPRASKVMFERMKAEKEERRGRDNFMQPTKVGGTFVTGAAAPVTTTTTTTTTAVRTTATQPPPPTRERAEAKSKMENLTNRLKKLNLYSSLLNIIVLMGLSWHLSYLSQRLHTHC